MTMNIVMEKRKIFKKSYDNRTYIFLENDIALRCGTESIKMYTNGMQEQKYLVNWRNDLFSIKTEIDETVDLLRAFVCNWIIN